MDDHVDLSGLKELRELEELRELSARLASTPAIALRYSALAR